MSPTELSIRIKFREYKRVDPFPDIPGTLLNSADITSYVHATGMIHPFYDNDLKPASYAARIAGTCKFWDSTTKTFETTELTQTGDKFVLEPNAIAFVGIEPTFRLPDYIALRFNLKITHVYRGLLLGTGPLIDPGFEGKISIPLHNLTSNDYVFSFNESLIWIEFTKTSPLPNVPKIDASLKKKFEQGRCQNYKKFPPNKTNQKLEYYLSKALEGNRRKEVVSSVPAAVNKAMELAEEAKGYAMAAELKLKEIKTLVTWSAIGGGLAIVVALAALLYSSWDIQNDYFKEAITQLRNVEKKLTDNVKEIHQNAAWLERDLEERIRAQGNIIKGLNYKNAKQQEIIEELQEKVSEPEKKQAS